MFATHTAKSGVRYRYDFSRSLPQGERAWRGSPTLLKPPSRSVSPD